MEVDVVEGETCLSNKIALARYDSVPFGLKISQFQQFLRRDLENKTSLNRRELLRMLERFRKFEVRDLENFIHPSLNRHVACMRNEAFDENDDAASWRIRIRRDENSCEKKLPPEPSSPKTGTLRQIQNKQQNLTTSSSTNAARCDDASKRITNKPSEKALFCVDHELKTGPTLLKSMRFVVEMEELVPRRPPFGGGPPYFHAHAHYQHFQQFHSAHQQHHHMHYQPHHLRTVLQNLYAQLMNHQQIFHQRQLHVGHPHYANWLHYLQQLNMQIQQVQQQITLCQQQYQASGQHDGTAMGGAGMTPMPAGAMFPPPPQSFMQRAQSQRAGSMGGQLPFGVASHQQLQQANAMANSRQQLAADSETASKTRDGKESGGVTIPPRSQAAAGRQSSIDGSSSANTASLNNAFSDLEALAAMGRDDGENSDRHASPSVSTASSFSDIHQQKADNQTDVKPNIMQLRMAQQSKAQSNLSGAEIFDFVPDDGGQHYSSPSSKHQSSDVLATGADESVYGDASTGRSSSASSRDGRAGGAATGPLRGNRPTGGVSSSMDVDSVPGTFTTPSGKKSRKTKKTSNAEITLQQAASHAHHVNPYLNSANYSTLQAAFSTSTGIPPNYVSSPSAEETRRKYEMAMLDDSSDEETDPPPPRNLPALNQPTYQQIQRTQRQLESQQQLQKMSGVGFDASPRISATSTQITSTSTILSDPPQPIEVDSKANIRKLNHNGEPSTAELDESAANAHLPTAPPQKSSWAAKLADFSVGESETAESPKLAASQKSSAAQFLPTQVKKEQPLAPPVLDIYDAEAEWEFNPEKDQSPKSTASSKERSTRNSAAVRQKDHKTSSAMKEGAKRKISAAVANSKMSSAADAEKSSESIKVVLKLNKSTSQKSRPGSSSSSPSSSYVPLSASSGSAGAALSSTPAPPSTFSSTSGVEPLVRLSSHAAPPSKSKSIHSKMYVDAPARNYPTSTMASSNRKRTNPNSVEELAKSGGSGVKKRSKDASLTNAGGGGFLSASIKTNSNFSKSGKRGSISSGSSSNTPANPGGISANPSASGQAANSGTTSANIAGSSATSGNSTGAADATPTMLLFPGLRNFKIPKVPEAVNETPQTATNAGAAPTPSSSQLAQPSVDPPFTSENNASGGGSGANNGGGGGGGSNGRSLNKGDRSDRAERDRIPPSSSSSSSSSKSNIQQQLQRRPNKSILKNSSLSKSERQERQMHFSQASASQQSSHRSGYGSSSSSSSKSRKPLLPTQTIRPQILQQNRLPAGNGGGPFSRGVSQLPPPYATNRKPTTVIPNETWAPAFPHHQEMALQQQHALYHTDPASGGGAGTIGGIGPGAFVAPYAKQMQAKKEHLLGGVGVPPMPQLASRQIDDEPASPDALQIAEDD